MLKHFQRYVEGLLDDRDWVYGLKQIVYAFNSNNYYNADNSCDCFHYCMF